MVSFLQRRVGNKWGRQQSIETEKKWYNIERLRTYLDQMISTDHEGGVVGAVRAATGGRPIAHGLSVGSGNGTKELRLVSAGLVERFDLYDLSEQLAGEARQMIAEAGLEGRVSIRVADAFKASDVGTYDLVYWDHALHHMFDVDKAIGWSLEKLNPGGLLVINEYVGPTRAQWRNSEIDFARRFLDDNSATLGADGSMLRYQHVLDRLRMIWRDHSEAPQSDRIMPAFARHCGTEMKPLGGVMIHLCTTFLPDDPMDPMYDKLMDWDRTALANGHWHFAFGIWRKPQDAAAAQDRPR